MRVKKNSTSIKLPQCLTLPMLVFAQQSNGKKAIYLWRKFPVGGLQGGLGNSKPRNINGKEQKVCLYKMF